MTCGKLNCKQYSETATVSNEKLFVWNNILMILPLGEKIIRLKYYSVRWADFLIVTRTWLRLMQNANLQNEITVDSSKEIITVRISGFH